MKENVFKVVFQKMLSSSSLGVLCLFDLKDPSKFRFQLNVSATFQEANVRSPHFEGGRNSRNNKNEDSFCISKKYIHIELYCTLFHV